MGCSRCGRSSPKRTAKPPPEPRTIKFIPPAVRVDGKFCPLCGWAIKESRYTDSNGQIIRKKTCTKKQCPNYK